MNLNGLNSKPDILVVGLPLLLFVVVETFESEKETEISKAPSYTVYCPERGIMLIIH